MSGITDALQVYRAEQRGIAASKIIINGVKAALAPFQPTEVLLYINVDFYPDSLQLRIKNLPDIEITLTPEPGELLRNPRSVYYTLAQQAYVQVQLALSERIEPPENCELGDN